MNIRLLLFSLVTPLFAAAQFLAPETSLQQAYIHATQQNRLIFLMIESADCQQCNEVADKAFQNDTLKNYIKQNFIALRISPQHADLNYLKDKYNYTGGNGVLFLDKWGTLIYRLNMSTTDHRKYIAQCKHALVRKTDADKIRAMELDAFTGKLETAQIYELMYKRKALSLPFDDLLDLYVSRLPADSLNSANTIKNIVRLSPALQSKADSAIRKNAPLFDGAWNSLLPGERVMINKEIIFKTRQKAVEEKNIAKGKEAAQFARLSYANNKQAADNAYYYSMMEFYRNMNDTAAYLSAAVDYYEHFQKGMNIQQIKIQDSIQMATQMKRQRTILAVTDSSTGKSRSVNRMSTVVRMNPQANRYSQLLNYGARSFYNMTKDPAYLKKALQWITSANDLFESPYVLDTWARLVYKVDKNVDKAIQLEEKAIAMLKKQGFSAEKHNVVLNKMKQGTLE